MPLRAVLAKTPVYVFEYYVEMAGKFLPSPEFNVSIFTAE
jgi:hypothetical protein